MAYRPTYCHFYIKVVLWANFLFDILIELAEIHNNLKSELDRSSGSKVMAILVSKLGQNLSRQFLCIVLFF